MSRAKILIGLSLVLLIIQSVSSIEWVPNNPKKETLCQTQECGARGKEYKNNRNAHVSPCDDFYTFACGNFRNNHPNPKFASELKMIHLMNSEFAAIIRKTLETYNFPPNDQSWLHLVKDVYETCAMIPEYPIKEPKDITPEIIKIGRVPNTPLWDVHSKYLKLSGESAFFGSKIVAHKNAEGVPVLMLKEPSSAFGSILHEENWKPQEKKAYTDFLFLIMKSLRLTGSDAFIKERIEKVFDFRRKLDRIIKKNSVLPRENFKPLTETNLHTWFLTTIHKMTNAQQIPWRDVMDVLLQYLPWQIRQIRKVVVMRQSQYFIDLTNLIKDVPEDVLGFHMEMFFIERHVKWNENMFRLLEATSAEPHDLLQYIRERHQRRWETCIHELDVQETLEAMLFQKWFPKDYTPIIHQIIGRLKAAIEKQMKNSKWLDAGTRAKTMERFNKMKQWIGFPTRSAGIEPSTARSIKEILWPDATYSKQKNLLYIHAPLLLPPLFSPSIPALYNYAGLGSTVGHEMYHVLDECGSYLDGDRNVLWWPTEMRIKCLSIKFHFIEEYNRITNREFKNRYKTDVKSDTSSSFGEDFADVMGLEAAYNAYAELASKEKSICKTLPNFEKYSCDQMFYIGFANSYCGYYTTKMAKHNLDTSKHSIDSVRVNGAVAQMKNFGTIFGCPVGSPMNPPKKLNVWQ